MLSDPDLPIRLAAFDALEHLTGLHGPVLHWQVLKQGFAYQGERVFFFNKAEGIFKPRQMRAGALSIKTTVPKAGREARYDDEVASDNPWFSYCYQGDDPHSHRNRPLRNAHALQAPLIYFYGIEPSLYWPLWPVFITHMDDANLRCHVVVDERQDRRKPMLLAESDPGVDVLRRAYTTRQTKVRLHQGAFRERVLLAYNERCAICNLPRRELIEAAHIVPDRDERGRPEVPNGLAMCSLHHSAFDSNLLGIRPDHTIEISHELLRERDGPVLEHALKRFDHAKLRVPRKVHLRPRADYLEERYERFRLTL
jgi:putative restriction endonuclease